MVSDKIASLLEAIYRRRVAALPLCPELVRALEDVLTDALIGVRALEQTVIPMVPDQGPIDLADAVALARLYLAGQRARLRADQARAIASALVALADHEAHGGGHACA